VLQHVGVCASFTAQKRREIAEFVAPYRKNALAAHPWKEWSGLDSQTGEAEHRMPGGLSRWSHMQGSRFRHTAQFRRWRTDKKPDECTYAQLEVVPPHELATIFVTGPKLRRWS
jgi:hypothetical protein